MASRERINYLRTSFERTPLTQIMGMRLIELSPESTIIQMPVLEWFIVSDKEIMQGGLTATLQDWAGVFLSMTLLEDGHTPLREARILYEKPITRWEILRACARLAGYEGHRINVVIDVYNLKDELKATGKFLFIKPKTP